MKPVFLRMNFNYLSLMSNIFYIELFSSWFPNFSFHYLSLNVGQDDMFFSLAVITESAFCIHRCLLMYYLKMFFHPMWSCISLTTIWWNAAWTQLLTQLCLLKSSTVINYSFFFAIMLSNLVSIITFFLVYLYFANVAKCVPLELL